MIKGQVSIDLLFAIIIFLVVIGIFLGYANNLEDSIKTYNSNLDSFPNYIDIYVKLYSVKEMPIKFNVLLDDFNFSYLSNKKQLILDVNNFYVLENINLNCDSERCWSK